MLRSHCSIPSLAALLVACGSQPAEPGPNVLVSDVAQDSSVAPSDIGDVPGETPSVERDAENVGPDAPKPEDVPAPEDVPGPGDVEPDPDVGPEPDVEPGEDVVPDAQSDRCSPPTRISPTRGPTTGGTRVEIVGDAWYIGALWWVAQFDDVVVDEIWDERPREECTLYFVTPPHEPGVVEVSVAYGARSPEIDTPFGTFTYE